MSTRLDQHRDREAATGAPAAPPQAVAQLMQLLDDLMALLRRLSAEVEEAHRERERNRHDALTGALERRAGLESLGFEMERCRRQGVPLVVAFVDVDGLKRTNDTYGHAAGDAVLAEVAAALATSLRSYDLVFRFGGDEFVCCVDDADIEDATERFAAVKARLAAGHPTASVSIGLAELRPNDTPESIIARADTAMYATRRRR